MKIPVLSEIKLSVFTFLMVVSVFAQDPKNNNSISNSKNGVPNFITFTENSNYRSANAQQIFKEQLGIPDNQSFVLIKSETDALGITHDKYQLLHNGIKVAYATYTLHSKNGRAISMSGAFYKIGDVVSTPTLSASTAFSRALAYIGASSYLWESPQEAAIMGYQQPQGELIFLPAMHEQDTERTSDKIRLAYKFDIYATQPVSRGDIYIDAITGEVLYYNATIKHLGEHAHGTACLDSEKSTFQAFNPLLIANAATRYSGIRTIETSLNGPSHVLFDGTRGYGISTVNMNRTTNYSTATEFTDTDNNWTAAEFNNTNKDNAALDAHWGAEKTYDYFLGVHGRNSYNNLGATINSYVHYSTNYNNAFWNGSVMTYGDGSGTVFDALTSLDVAAHEIGHAVCETTADLAYQRESGAMNEGFSDIWAACVEYFAAPEKSLWLIGEDIERRAGRAALRSMSNPKSLNQPDTYGGTFWISPNCTTPSQSNDYCGVHTNSGVLNHWFYILSVGKSGTNDIGSVYNVTGISIDKAAKIAYRLESVYLTSNATYANARTFGIQSAIDIYGANTPEVIATTNAFYAVGIGAAYSFSSTDTIPPSTPLNLIASGTTSNSTNLSWSASTDNVAVTGYNVYNGLNLVGTPTGTSFTVTGLQGSTTYTFTVKARDAVGNLSMESNSVNVTTLITLPTYCNSQGNSVVDELIGRVQLGTIDNTSTGGTGYTDFTAISTELVLGSNQTIIITPTWTGTIYPEAYAVFIDYNSDADFNDPGETVYTRAATTTTPISGSFTIPLTANLGATRMRVSMRYNALPTPCQTFDYGQVEDYTVILTSPNTVVSTKINIEGFYDTATHAMRPVMANQGLGSSNTDVGQVTLELIDPNTLSPVATTSAVLQTDGTAIGTFNSALNGTYYLTVKYRNCLKTWSALPVLINSSTPVYDFTNSPAKAYGSNMIEIEPGVWALFSGDLNEDGNVDNSDYTLWETDSNSFSFGNFATDLNGDGNVDNSDYTIWEANSNNFIFATHP
jgi:bacillolysin